MDGSDQVPTSAQSSNTVSRNLSFDELAARLDEIAASLREKKKRLELKEISYTSIKENLECILCLTEGSTPSEMVKKIMGKLIKRKATADVVIKTFPKMFKAIVDVIELKFPGQVNESDIETWVSDYLEKTKLKNKTTTNAD
ncbi:hypothetical protein FQR65_LT07589 [Abscondita terminalis]|nr:hypothetical protein FQR65_LT07589 [Abscondita terminalis]